MTRLFTFLLLGTMMLLVPEFKMYAADKKVGSVDYYNYAEGGEKPATPSSTTQKFYNSEGVLSFELTSSGLTTYAYNESGLLSEAVSYYSSYDLNQWVFSSKTSYEYDASNQIVRQNSLNEAGEITGYTSFENYINGKYQDRKSMSADGSTVYYWQQFEYTFNAGVLETTIQKYKPSAEDDAVILGKIEYVYTNDLLESEAFSPVVDGNYDNTAQGAYVITYDYDAEGNLTSDTNSSISRWGNYVAVNDYNYHDYSADYLPLNIAAQVISGEGIAPNTVQLTWDASTSGDVTGYMVIVDNLVEGIVTETTYTTSALTNGNHMFGVVAVVNGKTSTATDLVTLNVADAGVIPATNLSVVSISDPDESGAYPVELSWDAPVSDSEITSYRVYYSQYSYTEFTETSGIVNIPSWYAVGQDEFGDEIGLDVNLYVVTIYTTGIADPSNSVTVNAVDGTYTAIDDFEVNTSVVTMYPNPASSYVNFTEPVMVKIYTLSGSVAAVYNSYVESVNIEELTNGIYIVETTTITGGKTQTKLMVK
ncbi:T9SS type A sorting domain-containing protein [Plebeiibacterium marinum]|uniref:T9SS type A sorting domain-containing protein n=1 Tax=Plebeiibacterium marinum TaxID=2992111 RepID=A0AAE3SL18_9BACT|nr:T9SS type A sorting domain-containing protein [Plebeiobacterium marinum]MCW3807128.1 T9SS type A sorting domain-containing protein [Plebeiobacterium marinum]